MYCPTRYRTYQYGAVKYPVSWGALPGPPRKYAKLRSTHGTASAPMPWLYQKEATGMESSKMYCPSRCRYRTYQCGAVLYSVTWGALPGPKEICETSVLPIPMVPRLHQCNGYIKRKLRAWRVQKCIALVGEDTVLTSAGQQTTTCHWGHYSGPPRKYAKLRSYQYPWYRVCTNAMVISKGSYGHGEFKNVLP